MHVSIKWFDGKYPTFNVNIAKKEGQDEFLSIKGCRVVEGTKGAFVGWPSTKKDDGKYWNHAWGNETFNAHVLELAQKSQPNQKQSKKAEQDDDNDPPF